MEAWDNQLARLNRQCVEIFGRSVTYAPESGGEATVRAIVRRGQEGEDDLPGVYAVAFLRLLDLPAPPVRGDQVDIDGSRYRVYDIDADGSGAVLLRMRQV